jgi:molybdate transport system ATP-binding protein
MDALRFRVGLPLRGFRLDVALEAADGPIALVGPSGAGKTTLLRMLAGLVRPEEGSIRVGSTTWFDSEHRVDLPPESRPVGLVFQDYALFPHLSVKANVEFGGGEAASLLKRFGIAHLAHEKPSRISGGERQRVALARAFGRSPRVLLLDEPLAALDPQTRAGMRGELRELLAQAGIPTILVTHDYADAAALADRLAVIVDGRIVQTGTAAELVAAPATPFVADFVGGNVLRGRARAIAGGLTEVELADGTRLVSTEAATGDVVAVVYPWEIALGLEPSGDSAQNHVSGEIGSVVPVGNRVRITVGPLAAEVTAASAERLGLAPGQDVVATFKATGTRLLPRFARDASGNDASR